MPVTAGARLGAYEVLGPLGKGGMGEVWRARDTRLGRTVALKVIPDAHAGDPEQRARFESEARLASALNHPNVVTIHDVGTANGTLWLAMELVEGRTLRELLQDGALPVKRLLAIAAQVAEGLARAHEAGIVHRDLKPENVVVASDGLAKILDFGLAKLTAAPLEVSTLPTESVLTRTGEVFGTAPYMSPEQASGKRVDFRSDQFALGAILWEMASGERAFAGTSAAEVLSAILRDDPRTLPADVPAPLRWIVARCLAKDPAQRYASTTDLARDLASLRDHLPELGVSAAAPPRPRPRAPVFAAGAFAGAALVLAAALAVTRLGREAPQLKAPRVKQLTPAGHEFGSTISPDGRTFAYVSDADGTSDIYVRQVAGGDPVRLTHDAAVESDLAYAPDGDSLYYVTSADAAPAIWRVGVLGGTPRKIAEGARLPSPSRAGGRLAWVRTRSGPNVLLDRFTVEVASLDGSAPSPVVEAQGIGWIAFSPDGRSVAYSDGALFEPRHLRVVDVTTKSIRTLTRLEDGNVAAAAWLPDGRSLVVSIGADRFPLATGLDLAIAHVDRPGIERLLPNVNARFVSPSLSQDGRRLLASMERNEYELWKAPLVGDADANGRAARRLLDATWSPFWAQVSPDTRTVLFNSKAKGAWNLFTMPADASAPPKQVTFLSENAVLHAALSPDGSRVAYASQQDGVAQIWVAGVDGSSPRKLSRDAGPHYWPVFSRDGAWVYFSTGARGSFRYFRARADGTGEPEPVPGGEGLLRGDTSPVDDRFVAWGDDVIRLVDGAGTTVLKLPVSPSWRWSLPVFSPDGRSFTFAKNERDSNRAVWSVDVATGAQTPLVRMPGAFLFVFRAGYADGGRSIVLNSLDTKSNVVLVEGF